MDQIIESENRTSHAGEFETSIYLAAFPDRLRAFTMEAYDRAGLNYESQFAPDIEKFLAHDRRSRDGGLKGETIVATATRFFAKRLKKMNAKAE